ncbi:uncharacterized protein LOC119370115 [Jatropha curcas]|uniref:uncharacterized protein LOC119370115 n=1 Tax=Jatropha curcas TaxID=180498 RepID=UPI001895C5DC|nr:uncharacterized protein LOC119370115 [Jatropha curcas]
MSSTTVETPITDTSFPQDTYNNLNDNITKLIQQEVMKAIKGKGIQEDKHNRDTSMVNISFDLQTDVVIAIGKVESNLYHLNSTSFLRNVTNNACFSSNIANLANNTCQNHKNHVSLLWHIRLKYLSEQKLKHVPHLPGYDAKSFDCFVCPLSKQQTQPFYPSTSRADNSFDLVHMDLWGPYIL